MLHTHTHTYIHTYTHIDTHSIKMSEYMMYAEQTNVCERKLIIILMCFTVRMCSVAIDVLKGGALKNE